ncbi:MAE_28990/MAE_18760 family HEPN-like nuclease [Aquipseudomonas alcaligenes]|jgi:hypothetical protein|uniref:MAE_28990/MAE_18760 family HEPN-like nuclease n=1 Tax=Aquipseudomonas alcaligenes TaxID=43263 RepID=UPI001EEEC321|nr:MAE_28990/MAE_18760 family HEPN-like nuclease [Pseudomonas alcaligenes]
MLDTVREEFNKRSDEIDTLFAHIEALSDKGKESFKDDDGGLVSILVASLSLMLYNQIESTAFSCVEAIYDGLEELSVSFDSLVESFKERVLNDCRGAGRSGGSILKKIGSQGIGVGIAHASLKLDTVFSGNVDARKIRTVLGEYNLKVTALSSGNKGEALLDIKEARKSLAHGSSSFESYGRNIVVSDLKRQINEVREFMGHLIDLTEEYFESKRYLAETGAA